MKKNYLLILAALFMVTISCNNTTNNGAVNNAAAISATKAVDASFDGVAYIDTDSLIQGYKMFQDLNADFRIKAEKIERELSNKATKFDSDLKAFQGKIDKGLLTRTEAQQRQLELEKEQRVLLEFRDAKLKELREEEIVMMNKVSESVRAYIKKYNAVKKYKMILNTSSSMNVVLDADPSTDITTEVLNNLNAEYIPKK